MMIGEPASRLPAWLGRPRTERRTGDDRWLLFSAAGLEVRARCDRSDRVATVTVSYPDGRATLRAAAEPLGLWPACEPDAVAAGLKVPLLRRVVRGRAGRSLSMTASVRAGRITRVTLFDEAPDWR